MISLGLSFQERIWDTHSATIDQSKFFAIGCGCTVRKDDSFAPLRAADLRKKAAFARWVIMDVNNTFSSYIDKIELFAKAPLQKSFALAKATANKISLNNID